MTHLRAVEVAAGLCRTTWSAKPLKRSTRRALVCTSGWICTNWACFTQLGEALNQTAKPTENEGGKIKEGAARLDVAMMTSGAKTYGEFLNKRLTENPDRPIRTRLGTLTNADGKESQGYNFYPTRALFEQEFSELWAKQSEFYPDILTDELRDRIWQIIFFQRPLAPPKIGLCLSEDEKRLPKAHPVFQELRLYQTINALRIRDEDGRTRFDVG